MFKQLTLHSVGWVLQISARGVTMLLGVSKVLKCVLAVQHVLYLIEIVFDAEGRQLVVLNGSNQRKRGLRFRL
jgi:hypothetical protein